MSTALKWKLIAGFVLVFIAGGMAGAFLGAHAHQCFLAAHHHGMLGQRMRERFRAQLKLTPEQVGKISPISDKTAARLEEIRRDTGQRVRETIEQAHQEMASFLTDEQREKLQRMTRHHRHRRFFYHEHHQSPAATPPPAPTNSGM